MSCRKELGEVLSGSGEIKNSSHINGVYGLRWIKMDDLSQFLLKGMTMDLTTVLYSVNLLYLIALHIDPLKYDKDFIFSNSYFMNIGFN